MTSDHDSRAWIGDVGADVAKELRELRERCARLERERDEAREELSLIESDTEWRASVWEALAAMKTELAVHPAEAHDRCASLEAALRERMAAEDPLGLDDDWAPVRALLGPSPEGSPTGCIRCASLEAALRETRWRLNFAVHEFREAVSGVCDAFDDYAKGRGLPPHRSSVWARGALERHPYPIAPEPLLGPSPEGSPGTTPDPDDWRTHPELRDLIAKIPDDSDRTRAFRLLNEALSPDPDVERAIDALNRLVAIMRECGCQENEDPGLWVRRIASEANGATPDPDERHPLGPLDPKVTAARITHGDSVTGEDLRALASAFLTHSDPDDK